MNDYVMLGVICSTIYGMRIASERTCVFLAVFWLVFALVFGFLT